MHCYQIMDQICYYVHKLNRFIDAKKIKQKAECVFLSVYT